MEAATAPQQSSLIAKLGHVARDIKLSHTVFALPFALLAMFLAAADDARWPRLGEAGLMVLCMFFARTFAMTVNRWADATIDAGNQRTATRAIASGRLGRDFVLGVACVCGLAFIAGAGGFWLAYENRWPLVLAVPVLAILGAYSFMKRFTWLCHVFLGLALAVSPIAAAIAIHPTYLARPDVYLLAGMVLCWVAGFDVIYALQDVEADRSQELYSMPSRLGVGPALWISRALHVLALASLCTLAVLSPQLHMLFNLAVAATAALLVTEHALIIKSPKKHLNMAFFTVNGVISVALGAAGIVDVMLTA